MRIALVAPQISVLREPHMGGARTHLGDLAAGLTERGHQIDVFAATGSRIEGVAVIDTGIDASSLRDTLFRPDGTAGPAGGDLAIRAFGALLEPGSGLVFAGRLSPKKGAVEAIEISRRAGVPIDLYGDPYDPAYAMGVAALARQPGVTLHGAVSRTRLWRLLGAARSVLCPSTWEEPYGMVAAEAQAGTPVVGFRSGGLREVVADGVTGMLVDPGDIEGAAAAVHRLGGISRKACRLHALSHLDIESTLGAHERLYRSLGRPSGPAPHREATR